MQRLFGTDGVRGRAGEFPLDGPTVWKIGASLARQLLEQLGRPPRFVTGRDTRESGEWIETAFHAGAASEGSVCESAEVMTTPGIAYLTSAFNFDAGVVISASHNPYYDNGIKIFSPSGKKFGEATEREIEADIFSDASASGDTVGSLNSSRVREFSKAYVEHLLRESNGFSAAGTTIVVDCANGAASAFAYELLKSVGAEVIVIHDQPNGRNINENCGSLHLEYLRSAVIQNGADLGVAFDGDADRALFVDEQGNVVDGDGTLWIMAQYLKARGKLANSTVVATVMSNIGLELAFDAKGIDLLRTSVGDKYVLEKLIETGASIGGEQSGHIILPQISLVGDGMMTAMLMLRAITEKGVKLSEALGGFTRYPQILRNVNVREKKAFDDVPEIVAAADEIATELAGSGRLLLRYSGTENLARVMIEGEDQATIDAQAERLAAVIENALA
jgi:phosphoglucosamine mutase